MHLAIALLLGSIFFVQPVEVHGSSVKPCLPEGLNETDVVTYVASTSGKVQMSDRKPITVKDKLAELKARCRRGKLVDSKRREIRFYHLVGCWGNPPADYQEILERQRQELENLKKRYTVIELSCNSDPMIS